MMTDTIENEANALLSGEEYNPEIMIETEPETGSVSLFDFIKSLFEVETGVGTIEEYQENPLCFDRSEGLAQILRGSAGFMGANLLRSAILDIVIGSMKWLKGLKGGN